MAPPITPVPSQPMRVPWGVTSSFIAAGVARLFSGYRALVQENFRSKYGPCAVIAGASEGLGAAFAESLAARGLDLVLLARRASLLEPLAEKLAQRHGVKVYPVVCDLASPALVERLRESTEGLEVGLGVYNAAYAFVGPLLERPLADALRVVDVNIRGPLSFVHALAPAMTQRRRGGLVLMSSLAGLQGGPRLAPYAASKAFNTVLGQSLWAELAPQGIDVTVCCAGATRTPNYLSASKGADAPGTLDPEQVAEAALEGLGRTPFVVPGAMNKLAAALLTRFLPRRAAIQLLASSSGSLQEGG